MKIERQQIRILALAWGIRNVSKNPNRSARWFAIADKYEEVAS